MSLRRPARVVTTVICVVAITGCGGGTSVSASAIEARFSRALDVFKCPSMRAESFAAMRRGEEEALRELRAVKKIDVHAPRVARWLADYDARIELRNELAKGGYTVPRIGLGPSFPVHVYAGPHAQHSQRFSRDTERVYLLSARLHADEKALTKRPC